MPTEGGLARLTRYEALFELSSDMNVASDIVQAGQVLAARLKYVADVFSWRYVAVEGEGEAASNRAGSILIIDGYRGRATVATMLRAHLSRVEWELWEAGKACIITGDSLVEAQKCLPELFQKEDITQVYVYPVFVDRQLQSMFLFSKRRQPFNELDIKFIAIDVIGLGET